MTSSSQENKKEQVAGDELNEPEDEESGEISGDELNEPEDEESGEISGDELSEPEDEESGEINGDELSEPGDEESKAYKDKQNKSKGTKNKSNDTKKKSNDTKKQFGGKRKLALFFAIGTCLLAGGIYYFSQDNNEKEVTALVNIFPIPHDTSFTFETFIVPLPEKQGHTYISLNLSFELSNVGLVEEIIKKKEQLRGIIFDVLVQGIDKIEDAHSLKKLRELIVRRANTVLFSGKVSEAIIIDFVIV